MSRYTTSIVFALATLLTAVPAASQSFVTSRAYTEAVYLLDTTLGQPGSITVRAAGVSEGVSGFGTQTVIHLRFEFVNQTEYEIEFPDDELRLDWWSIGEEPRRNLRADRVRGPTEFEPGEAGTVDVYFGLGPGLSSDPDDIDSFRVRWTFESDATLAAQVVQYTVFTAYRSSGRTRFLFTPFFDPFIPSEVIHGLRLRVHPRPFRHRRFRHRRPNLGDHHGEDRLPNRRFDGRPDTFR
jgi:hypothetical protein